MRDMRIAVLNVGTGTVKAAVATVAAESGGRARVLRRATVEREAERGAVEAALRRALDEAGAGEAPLDALAHRVVHGGTRFREPVRVDAEVERALGELAELAPLHNPPALEGIRTARRLHPGLPEVAVFDTAFHATREPVSRRYALPRDLARSLSIERFGFHGIAHASLVDSLARAEGGDPGGVDAVTLQLGSGCSACAIAGGRSVETSMGFSPLEGLVMATRCGDLDAAAVLRLLRAGRSADEVDEILNLRSGLLGLAGSADLRDVLRAEAAGDGDAALAVALFVRRIVATTGAYLTLLGGRGSIVFGGGIGANSAEIRARVAAGLAAWNVRLDPARNATGARGRLSDRASRPVYAFDTDEETLIAGAAAGLLASPAR